jgi:hypothetical protein
MREGIAAAEHPSPRFFTINTLYPLVFQDSIIFIDKGGKKYKVTRFEKTGQIHPQSASS